MKKTLKMAIAFISLAGAAATAHAATQAGPGRNDKLSRFERADTDKSGDVTFEEFAALMNKRFAKADANGDGKITIGELAEQIHNKKRAERMAEHIVKRYDANGDGVLTKAEIENRQKKLFALLDVNDDGKLVKDELPQRQLKGKHHERPHGKGSKL